MMIRELLEKLDACDIKVWVEGADLRCSAPKGALTPELQADLKSRKTEVIAFLRAGEAVNSSLVPIQPKGSRPPIFALPGHNGDVFCFVPLVQHLGEDQPFYGLQPPGFIGEQEPFEDIPSLAAHYVRQLKAFYPEGPYYLGGDCAGGTVAFELAQQLTAQGDKVALLAIFESPFPGVYSKFNRIVIGCRYLLDRIPHHLRRLLAMDGKTRMQFFRNGLRVTRSLLFSQRQAEPPTVANLQPDFKERIAEATVTAVKAYKPALFPGRIHIFLASEDSRRHDYNRVLSWSKFALQGAQIYVGPEGCVGANMLLEPHVEVLQGYFQQCLALACANVAKEFGVAFIAP
jgi:thioesterase domain-containing protein